MGHTRSVDAATRDRILWLWLLFSVVGFSLGYATLNRYDPSRTEGVSDSACYFKMTRFDTTEVPAPYRFRVLTPTLAGLLIPALTRLPHGAWNVTSLALLVINSLFVSMSALLLFQITMRIGGSGSTALVASLLYITCFPVPNGHLAGLVDAGEGFVLLALISALLHAKPLPCVGILSLSAIAKESAVLFGSVILLVWWFASRGDTRSDRRISPSWSLASIAAGVLVLWLVRSLVGGPGDAPQEFSMNRLSRIGEELILCLKSRSVIYSFLFLLPTGLLGIQRVPRVLLAASAVAGLVAYLAGAYAGIGENVARPLFNTVGPVICIGSALFLEGLVRGGGDVSSPQGSRLEVY